MAAGRRGLDPVDRRRPGRVEGPVMLAGFGEDEAEILGGEADAFGVKRPERCREVVEPLQRSEWYTGGADSQPKLEVVAGQPGKPGRGGGEGEPGRKGAGGRGGAGGVGGEGGAGDPKGAGGVGGVGGEGGEGSRGFFRRINDHMANGSPRLSLVERVIPALTLALLLYHQLFFG